jgi:hypothetical protein
MKIKVIIKEYLMEEVGEVVYDVYRVFAEGNDMTPLKSFFFIEEAEAWVRTQEDLTL